MYRKRQQPKPHQRRHPPWRSRALYSNSLVEADASREGDEPEEAAEEEAAEEERREEEAGQDKDSRHGGSSDRGWFAVNTANAGSLIATGGVDSVVWRAVPRTEAAVRSGMPLYGIDGLMPIATMLNADATIVRTTYRLESGETADITQQKMAGARTGAPAGSVTVSAERPVVDVQNARQTVVNSPFFPSLWTIVRGDVQLTLRGPDAQALGAKLRLD